MRNSILNLVRPALSAHRRLLMRTVLLLLITHHFLAVFMQSFFLHRYSTHRQFSMSRGWEKFFHVMTYLILGIGYLVPRAYREMYLDHHKFADGKQDPHAPSNAPHIFAFVYRMYLEYHRYEKEPRSYEGPVGKAPPEWPLLDQLNASGIMKLFWIATYGLIYYACGVRQGWQFIFIGLHAFLSGLQGVIVNWCGHRYGYRNFDTPDDSRNTLWIDFLIWGELFQNNHHQNPGSPNFAARWYEIDLTYQVMRVFAWMGIISFRTPHNTA